MIVVVSDTTTIALAKEINADVIIMDEKAGRKKAASIGLRMIGLLGILLQAKRRRLIKEVKPVIEKLDAETDFYIGKSLESKVLLLAGEYRTN
ncbi:MAG: DUF3368 domain-containing protein [Bacteroidota bacterium]